MKEFYSEFPRRCGKTDNIVKSALNTARNGGRVVICCAGEKGMNDFAKRFSGIQDIKATPYHQPEREDYDLYYPFPRIVPAVFSVIVEPCEDTK